MTFRLVCTDGRTFSPGTVLDLSTSGVRFRSSVPLAVGQEVDIVPLGQAGEILFDVSAIVVRVAQAKDREDRWIVALQFLSPSVETEQALARLTESMPRVDEVEHLDPDPPPAPANDDGQGTHSMPHIRMRTRKTVPPKDLTGS